MRPTHGTAVVTMEQADAGAAHPLLTPPLSLRCVYVCVCVWWWWWWWGQVCLDRLAAGTEALAEVLVKEQGKPLSGATGEIAGCGALLKKAIELELPVEVYSDTDECRIETRRAPLGVIACITPWNYPMFCAVQKWAAALVVGNTVVLKPSPFTPLTQLAYAAMVADAFPPGVFNVISGADAPGQFNVGAFLTSHPDVSLVSFTGSIATGKRIYEASAPDMKRVTLECGGNDAAIVLPDADVAAAAKGVVGSAFANTGQLCCAAKRIFVHESIAEDFKKAAVAAVAATKFDDGFAEGCTHGPLNNKMQFDKVTELVEDAKATGATVLCGGARMGGEHQDGFFFAPTIVADVKEGHRIVDEEQFGPVMPIITSVATPPCPSACSAPCSSHTPPRVVCVRVCVCACVRVCARASLCLPLLSLSRCDRWFDGDGAACLVTADTRRRRKRCGGPTTPSLGWAALCGAPTSPRPTRSLQGSRPARCGSTRTRTSPGHRSAASSGVGLAASWARPTSPRSPRSRRSRWPSRRRALPGPPKCFAIQAANDFVCFAFVRHHAKKKEMARA